MAKKPLVRFWFFHSYLFTTLFQPMTSQLGNVKCRSLLVLVKRYWILHQHISWFFFNSYNWTKKCYEVTMNFNLNFFLKYFSFVIDKWNFRKCQLKSLMAQKLVMQFHSFIFYFWVCFAILFGTFCYFWQLWPVGTLCSHCGDEFLSYCCALERWKRNQMVSVF